MNKELWIGLILMLFSLCTMCIDTTRKFCESKGYVYDINFGCIKEKGDLR